jgi:hypothetical protein
MIEQGYCFRGYNNKTVLPEWDVEEEKYNNWPYNFLRGWICCLRVVIEMYATLGSIGIVLHRINGWCWLFLGLLIIKENEFVKTPFVC